jgi:hypothetical protein
MKKLLFALLTITMVACEKNESEMPTFDNDKDAKMISSLKQAYGLTTFNGEPNQAQREMIFSALTNSTGVYQKVSSKILKNSIRLFENKNEGITIAMMRFEDSPEKYYSVKGTFVKGTFQIASEFLFGRKVVDKNNGQIIITNNNEATMINIENGVQTYSQLGYNEAEYRIIQVTDCHGNHGGTGFCQREAGESFSTCYKAEKDEFCDGFWSCIAVDTQPQVMLLIAAACGCSATQCPR